VPRAGSRAPLRSKTGKRGEVAWRQASVSICPLYRGWDHFYRRPLSLGAFIGGCGIRHTSRHRAAFARVSFRTGRLEVGGSEMG